MADHLTERYWEVALETLPITERYWGGPRDGRERSMLTHLGRALIARNEKIAALEAACARYREALTMYRGACEMIGVLDGLQDMGRAYDMGESALAQPEGRDALAVLQAARAISAKLAYDPPDILALLKGSITR